MEHNPFAPPKAAVLETPAPPTEDEIASRTRRFINMVIDAFAQIALMLILMIVAVIVYPPFAESRFLQEDSALSNYLLGIVIMVLYYLPCEALFGRTLGKLITGTRVVDENGDPPSFKQILGRTLARMIPLEAFTFLKSSGIGAHDSLPGTRVVRNSYGRV